MTVASFHDPGPLALRPDSSLLPFCLSSSFRLLFPLSYSNSLPVLHHSQEFSCFCSGSSFQSFVPGARTTSNLSILKLIQNLSSSYTLIELPILSQIFHHSLFPMPHYRNKHNINPPEPRTSVFYSAVRCKFWPNYSVCSRLFSSSNSLPLFLHCDTALQCFKGPVQFLSPSNFGLFSDPS